MKLFKITAIAFICTIIFSSVDSNAKSLHFFTSMTLPGHSKVYNSSVQSKTIESSQYFKNTSAYDKITWQKRAVRVQIENVETSGKSSYQEINTEERKEYKENSVRYDGNYRINIKTANPLSSDIYFNGKWYLDNTQLDI